MKRKYVFEPEMMDNRDENTMELHIDEDIQLDLTWKDMAELILNTIDNNIDDPEFDTSMVEDLRDALEERLYQLGTI
jgi:hypothetical protein